MYPEKGDNLRIINTEVAEIASVNLECRGRTGRLTRDTQEVLIGAERFHHPFFICTESLNHRILGVGRDLCGSSSPTPLPKQGHLQQAAQDFVQVGLEYLQRRRLHNLPGQPVPGLHHPRREEVLPHVQLELPMLRFVPIAPCPVAGHH